MNNLFTAHPASVGETYAQHCRFAFRFGARMPVGGVAAMVHAPSPFWFVTTARSAYAESHALRIHGAQPPLSPDR